VQRKEGDGSEPPAKTPDVSTLAEEALTAIAQKETKQRSIESSMDTSAGVKASYRSQVQATASWTMTTLKKLSPAERKKFGVTKKELNAAEARARAAGDLWTAVMASGATSADDVKKDGTVTKALTASGLSEADVDRMIDFRDLRVVMDETTDAALAKAEEEKGEALTYRDRNKVYKTVGRTVAGHEHNAELGMRHTSLRSHIRQDKEPKRSAMWREDMAGWQRKAVGAGPKGAEIEQAATADNGLALGRARITGLVRAYVAANPKATAEQVVHHVARKHNPRSRNYARDVVKIWRTQAKARAAAEAAAKAEADKASPAADAGDATESP